MADKNKDAETVDQVDDVAAQPVAVPSGTQQGDIDPNATANAVAIETQAAPEPPDPKRGEMVVRYAGSANVFTFSQAEGGDIHFRPGVWTTVKKDVAEDLLTFPNERFEVMEATDGDSR